MLYTVILGSANSGKTTYFLENFTNNIVFSTLDLDKILYPTDIIRYKFTFYKLKENTTEDDLLLEMQRVLQASGSLSVLVDEIHFFSHKQVSLVWSACEKIQRQDRLNVKIFFTLLLSSYQQNFRFESESRQLNNVQNVLVKANNIVVLNSPCAFCANNFTVQNGVKKEKITCSKSIHVVGKDIFCARCADCRDVE